MATEAIVFFDSRLAFDDLGALPAKLLAECPSVAERKDDWTTPFSWGFEPETDRFIPEVAAEFWASPQGVSLFCPIGHLDFRQGSVEWHSFVKVRWLDEEASRAWLIGMAGELAG